MGAVEECRTQMESDTRLQPGQEGWWRVWGAKTWDVKVGDIIVTSEEEGLVFDEVTELSIEPTRLKYVNQDGKTWTIGHASRQNWFLYRKGTHNTLA
jgi:hypothetical protein